MIYLKDGFIWFECNNIAMEIKEKKMSDKSTTANVTNNKVPVSDRKMMWILFLVTFVITAGLGSVLNIACVLDESGTVANAAFVAGYNWHDWVGATGNYYYKYGSSLLYIPIFFLFNNPYVIYKLILAVNAVLISVVPVCAYRVLRTHLNVEDKKLSAITAFAVGIVPASVLYSLNAKADVALISWTWVLLVTILECMSAKEKCKQYVYSVLIGVVSVYLYMCHTRGVVFVIAAFMVVFALRFMMKNRNVKFFSYLASLAVMMLLDDRLKTFFKLSIWGAGKKKNTLEGYDFQKFRKMLSWTGAETMIKSGIGWFFDTIIGNYGLVLVGFFFALFIFVMYLKKKDVSQKEFVVALYGGLVFVGTMALGLLFFFMQNFKLMADKSNSRVDRMFYSRYMSPTYAIMVLIAIYYLFIKTDRFGLKTKIFVVVFSILSVGYVGTWLYDLTDRCGFSWRNVLDCGMFYTPEYFGKDSGDYSGTIVANALMKGAVLGLVVLIVMMVMSHKYTQYKKLLVSFVVVCFAANLSCNYVKLRFDADMRTMNVCGSVFTAVEGLVDQYETLPEEFGDIYYDKKSSSGYKFYQMGLPNFNVLYKKRAKFEEMDNGLIITRNHVVNERWFGEDCYLLEDYDYENNVNAVIVKGDELKSALEAHGIKVVEMPQDYAEKEKVSVSADYWQAVKTSFRHQWESLTN